MAPQQQLPIVERAHHVVVSPPPPAPRVIDEVKAFICRWQYHAGVAFSTGGVAAFLISSISSKWVLFEVATDPDGKGLSEERHARVIAHLGPWIACNQGNSCHEPWDVAPGLKEWTVRGVQFMFVLSILVNVTGISSILLRVTQPEWLPVIIRNYLTHGPIHCLIPIGAVLAFLAMLTMGELKRQVLLDYALDVKPGWALVVSLLAVISTVTGIVLMLLSPSHTITPRRCKTSSPTAALFRRLERRGQSAAPSAHLSLSAERVHVEMAGKGAISVAARSGGGDGPRYYSSGGTFRRDAHGNDRNENSSAAIGGACGGGRDRDSSNEDGHGAGDCAIAASGRVFSFLCGHWEDGDANDVPTFREGEGEGDSSAYHPKGRPRTAHTDLSHSEGEIHDTTRPPRTAADAPSELGRVHDYTSDIARPRPRPTKMRSNQLQNLTIVTKSGSPSTTELVSSSEDQNVPSISVATRSGKGDVMSLRDCCQQQISSKTSGHGETSEDFIDLEENVDVEDIPIVFKTGELNV